MGAGHLYLLTLTAPGNREHTNTRTGETCPCTPAGGVDLAAWNASASACWNRLRTALKRSHGTFRFMRVVEVQDRGALHLHVLVKVPAAIVVEQLREPAIAAGFGHSVDLAPIVAGSRRHAYYVSKYVTKAADQRSEVPWRADVVDRDSGEIRCLRTDARYRTWSSSRDWGITMKDIRAHLAAARTAQVVQPVDQAENVTREASEPRDTAGVGPP